jgi:hypothetical protein
MRHVLLASLLLGGCWYDLTRYPFDGGDARRDARPDLPALDRSSPTGDPSGLEARVALEKGLPHDGPQKPVPDGPVKPPPDGPKPTPDGLKKGQGEKCGAPGECSTGFCVDGVCCESACAGTCEACNLPGKAGTCSPIASGIDPDKECLGKDAACGGSCNGARACAFPGATTTCKPPNCSGASLTTSTCDGSGGCVTKTAACPGSYQCLDAVSCRASCAAHSQCSSGFCDLYGFPHGATMKNTCAAPADVCIASPSDVDGIQKCLDLQKPYVVLANGTHTPSDAGLQPALLTKAPVQIVGTGTAVPLLPPLPAWPWPTTSPSAKVQLPGAAKAAGVFLNHSSLIAGLEIYRKNPPANSSQMIESYNAASEFHSSYLHHGGDYGITAASKGIKLHDVVLGAGNAGSWDTKWTLLATGPAELRRVVVTTGSKIGINLYKSNFDAQDLYVNSNLGDGVVAEESTLKIDRAFITGNSGYGLDLKSTSGNVWNAVISANGSAAGLAGVRVMGTKAPAFYNITVADSGGVEVECNSVFPALPGFYNSIVWNSKTTSIYAGVCGFSYSDVRGASSGSNYNINQEPLFAGQVYGGGLRAYDLLPSSPCIGAGSNTLPGLIYPSLDALGRPRTKAGKIDMGALQVQ